MPCCSDIQLLGEDLGHDTMGGEEESRRLSEACGIVRTRRVKFFRQKTGQEVTANPNASVESDTFRAVSRPKSDSAVSIRLYVHLGLDTRDEGMRH